MTAPDREELEEPIDITGPVKPPERAGTDRSRYTLVTRGEDRWLICGGQEGVRLRAERGLTVNEAGRKRYPERTIFLDGVFTGPPFYDNKSRQYSLDHHAGCVRAFTLSTCEQAAVVVLQGLPLDEGEWTLYLNEPDLDAVLAAWVLLNHTELLRDEAKLLHQVMPLIRVEGVIDAHGLDMAALAALPDPVYEEQKRIIDGLLGQERSLKASSSWSAIDAPKYTRELLEALDAALFPAGRLARLLEVEEQGRLPLQGGRLALLCRSDRGIYEVERDLKERHEKTLGVIVLDLGEGRFTVRQVYPFLDQSLRDLYALLNQKDPRASRGNGQENLWGGSDEIGGSPRATGSGLEGAEVLRLVQQVYGQKRGWLRRLLRRP